MTDEAVSDFNIWLSRELTLVDKVNTPDIMSAPATVDGGTATLTLPEPYRITPEGVYTGLTFTVGARDNDAQKNPVANVPGPDSFGLYLHTSRTYSRWADRSGSLRFTIPVTLTLANLPETAAAITLPGELNAGVGEQLPVKATLINRGATEIKTVTLSYSTSDGISGTVGVDLPAPVKAGFNRTTGVDFTLPAPEAKGSTTLTVTAAAVNGDENPCAGKTVSVPLNIYSRVPQHRPLMEEYTGMGCGWCPRGAIGIEKMRELYGDRFIAVAHHCDDDIAIFPADGRPNHAPSQPVAWIDRYRETDPYNGDNTTARFGIDKVWEQLADSFTPADISVEWDWADDSRQTIEASSTVTFVKPFSGADFRVAYMVVADGLTDPDWYQGNYYSGKTGEYPAEFDFLVNAPQYILNPVFDDVTILAPSHEGIPGSLPAEIKADEPMTHTAALQLADAVSLSGKNLVQDKERLRVVAVVIDGADGRVLNAACGKAAKSGLVDVTVDKEAAATVDYDLTGRPVADNYRGVVIRSTVYTDGSRSTTKLLRR